MGRGQPLGLPDLEAGQYLLAALFDAGPCNGDQPLSWLDVWAYGQAAGAITEPWEYRALMSMSVAYAVAKAEGADPLAIAPVDQ